MKGRSPRVISSGVMPHPDDTTTSVTSLVSPTDPAFRDILRVIASLRLLRIDVGNPEIVKEAVAAGRRIHEAGDSDALKNVEGQFAARHEPKPTHRERVVYYARMGTLCKIGFTEGVKNRMTALRPEELLATEPGGPEVERQRHEQFAELRNHGEWYRYEGPLVEHVERLRAEAGA